MVIIQTVKIYLFIFAILLPEGIGYSQVINKEPLSVRQTYYNIDAVLNTDTKTVTGKMTAYWVNKSTDIVPDIRLHLYMNGFKSSKTTLGKEMGDFMMLKKPEPGWIDLNSFTDRKGNDLLQNMSFISPDDGNPEDQTVVRVVLPKPALPGDTVYINIDFETRLPTLTRRTGFSGDYYFVAQWFPKFGVYEPAGMRYSTKGEWNCHQFHATSEFYSNHSLYDVKITLPQNYITATCGMLVEKDSVSTGENKTLTFRAEDIVDFAWTAWPGYAVYSGTWKHVKITLLIPKDRPEQVERQITAVKNALEYLTANVGPYPWSYVTIVDPPAMGNPAGGMEYTTLFTSSSAYFMPRFMHMPEMVTIHEFGHAYFMGMMASNEFEEPWLDEGVNTFFEERIVDHYYGENSGLFDHPLLKVSDKSSSRLSYVHSPNRQVVSNNEYSWHYPHGTYGMMAYNKTATWLYTLMGIVGEETTNEIFRDYYRNWAFKHPSGKDFVNTVNETVRRIHGDKFGNDMNWFFEQTLYGTGICDYKVAGFFNRKIEAVADSLSSADTLKADIYNCKVELERTGEVMLPVEVLIHFSNGEEVSEMWDGKSRFKDFEYTGAREVEWVKIDPGYKIRMDVNFINNSMTRKPDQLPVRRFTNKLISFIQFFMSLISL
jgi:hypothetical protein